MVGCVRLSLFVVALSVGCATHHKGNGDDQMDSGYVPDACDGLACFQVNCGSKSLPPTTLSGTVFAPNGTLPLYGVNVYVPAVDPGPLVDGSTCSKCADGLQGGSLAAAVTDEAGHFDLENVPATANVPVVIQVGKWRRQLNIANVAACQTLPLDAIDTTLPKSMTDMTPNTTGVDMPRIAISAGNADALECLVLKLGVAAKEIGTAGSAGRIHLYSDNGAAGSTGRTAFQAGWAGGSGAFADSQNLWNPVSPHTGGFSALKPYDIVILSCEGQQYPGSKPQQAMDALKQYADQGGRVFASHWHNIWISGQQGNPSHGIPDWEATSHFSFAGNPNPDTLTATIDEVNNPKGMSFATWMQNVGGSSVRDLLTVTQSRNTCDMVDNTKAERWVYLDPPTSPVTAGQMNFQFTTPQDQPVDQRCGKVVFSDMHVSADSVGTLAYPSSGTTGGCSALPLTAQEKALAFMFFDIASCVGSVF